MPREFRSAITLRHERTATPEAVILRSHELADAYSLALVLSGAACGVPSLQNDELVMLRPIEADDDSMVAAFANTVAVELMGADDPPSPTPQADFPHVRVPGCRPRTRMIEESSNAFASLAAIVERR